MPMFSKIDTAAGSFSFFRMNKVLAVIAANFGLLEPAIVSSVAANYQPSLTDRHIRRTKADGAQTTTIPTNAQVPFPVGVSILIEQASAQTNTFVAASGVTLNKLATKGLATVGQFGIVRALKVGTNEWTLSGDLGAP